jgi:outer membrane protein OmpA-like peptidoglycan-associated protein
MPMSPQHGACGSTSHATITTSVMLAAILSLVGGCAQLAAPLPPPVPFDEAVLTAANKLFSSVPTPTGDPPRYLLVIDPLVDGVTGTSSYATETMGERLSTLVREKYPQFDLRDFSADTVEQKPLVLVGTFTGLNSEGKPIGEPAAYRVCLVLADLKSGKTVAKGTARALPGGFDTRPLPYFADSPTWRKDQRVEGYIKTCQGTQPGSPIDPAYLDGVQTAALVSKGVDAYNAGQYQQALDYYNTARQTPAGDQLRVYNGIYMAHWKLNQRDRAEEAFGEIVDYGLRNDRIGVKFLFRPGSTAFWPDRALTEPYPLWLRQIAQRSAAHPQSCLEITGHTSPTGTALVNERLSLQRAEYIRSRLEADVPELKGKLTTSGVGPRENIIGTGADDRTDALDRRVEFKPMAC